MGRAPHFALAWPTREQWRREWRAALHSTMLRTAVAGVLFALLLLSFVGQLQVPHERRAAAEAAAAEPTIATTTTR